MATNEITERDEINERSAAQVLMLMMQSYQRQTPPTNDDFLLVSSSDETETLSSPILRALEAEGGLQIYLQDTNFGIPRFMRYMS